MVAKRRCGNTARMIV